MLLSILLIIIILFVIDKCTVINLSPKLLFNQNKYKKFPELNDGLQCDKFSIERATQTSNAGIQYFPKKNFFLINNLNPIKIDSIGNKVFELDIEKQHTFNFLEIINCFVVGIDSIYDFSDDKSTSKPFNEVLNKDKSIKSEKWTQIFEQLYQSSDIVLYGWRTEFNSAQCVYFHAEGKWTKLYLFDNLGSIYIFSEGSKTKCKIKGKEIPHKWYETHYLKDVKKAKYSNEYRYTDSYITPYNIDVSFFPDQKLKYQSIGEIKTLAFSKEAYTTEGYLNPGIPSAFYGTGYYELTTDNATLSFRTIAYKNNGLAESIQTDTYLFSLPEAFANKSEVCFLSYDYSTNFHENNKKGVYVIKKHQQ